jgi:hypothetical protein
MQTSPQLADSRGAQKADQQMRHWRPARRRTPLKEKPSDERETKNGPKKPNKTKNKPKTSRRKTKIRLQFHPKHLTRHHLHENQEQQLPQHLVFPAQLAGHQCQPHSDTGGGTTTWRQWQTEAPVMQQG